MDANFPFWGKLGKLLWIEARTHKPSSSINIHGLYRAPFLRWLALSWFGKHVVDPSRSLGLNNLHHIASASHPVRF